MKLWTPSKIRRAKGQRKLPCLTAYDTITARIADSADAPLILVGDSLAPTALGHGTTLPATMDVMLHHTAAVVRGVAKAVVVGDMPFLSYQISDDEAVRNAGRFLQEAGADAVKIEGGRVRAALIRRLVENGIPVMAHIGLLPQSVNETGWKVRGRDESDRDRLRADAQAVAEAGAFSVVLECVMPDIAAEITREVPIPTVGIGSGAECDGQFLVFADMLGLTEGKVPSFVKRFADVGALAREGVRAYCEEVSAGTFPDAAHQYSDK